MRDGICFFPILAHFVQIILLLGVGCDGFSDEGKDRACNSAQAFDG